MKQCLGLRNMEKNQDGSRKIIRCLICNHARVKHRFTDLRGLTPSGAYRGECWLIACDCQEYVNPE